MTSITSTDAPDNGIRAKGAWLPYAAITAVWLATRMYAFTSVDLTPWMLHDLTIYEQWLGPLSDRTFPTSDPTWQYPPGAAPVFLLSGHWPIDYRWSFTIVILCVDLLVLVTLMTAHWRERLAPWRGLWLWALAGVIVGPIMMVRFDVVPTLFAVLAVVLASRPAWSGAASAVGTVVKVWPVLMLLALPRKGLRSGLLSYLITAAVLLLAFWLTFDHSFAFLENQRDRGLQVESTGALPYLLFSVMGGKVATGLSYGSIQVLMQGAETVGTVLTVIGLAGIGVLAWFRLRGRFDAVPAGDVAMAVLLVSVTTSRVYSPQFNTWLIGVAAAATLARLSRLGVVVLLIVATSLLTQIVYPWSATQLVTGELAGILPQALRICLLIAATALSLVAIFRRELVDTA